MIIVSIIISSISINDSFGNVSSFMPSGRRRALLHASTTSETWGPTALSALKASVLSDFRCENSAHVRCGMRLWRSCGLGFGGCSNLQPASLRWMIGCVLRFTLSESSARAQGWSLDGIAPC